MTNLTDAWLECREDSLESASIATCIIEKYPDVVDAWLRETAHARLSLWVTEQERRQRLHRRQHAFADAVLEFEAGGSGAAFVSTFRARAPFLNKAQGDLRRADIDEIIEGYTKRRIHSDVQIRVWEKIRKKVGLRQIDEVFTEEQFEQLFGIHRQEEGVM